MWQYFFKLHKFFKVLFNTSLRKWETKLVSTLYFIIFVKKEINACLRINIDVFFIKIMLGNYETCPVITPNSFFSKGQLRDTILTIRRRIAWNRFHISKVYYLFVFTSQTNKSVLNWVVLILIEQNVILKARNHDFPQSKIDYVITLLKWLVRSILFLFLVVYRSTFKVVLKFSEFYFIRSHFGLSRFYPIVLTVP